MAFNTAVSRVEYTASSGQTNFPFTFKIYKSEDVTVYLTPVGQEPNDTTDILILATDYTVTVTGDVGGSIDLISGATSGDEVTIVRTLELTREIDYQTNGDLLAETLNQDQNYQAYILADLETSKSRFIQIPTSAQGVSATLPDVSPDNYIKWKADGTGLENDVTSPTWATAAASSASAAASSASAASTSESNAANSLSTFNGQYVSQATAPTSPIEGMLWFDTVANELKVYKGSTFAALSGGQYYGDGVVKGIEYFAQSSVASDDIVIDSTNNALSVESFTLEDGASLTIEDGAVYKIV